MPPPIAFEDASPEVRAVFDDIMRTRGTDWVNNFWQVLAHHPPTLRRTWDSLREIMAPNGVLDPLTKELIYLAVSVTNGCAYCVASHTAAARKAGASEARLGEALAWSAWPTRPTRWPSPTKCRWTNAFASDRRSTSRKQGVPISVGSLRRAPREKGPVSPAGAPMFSRAHDSTRRLSARRRCGAYPAVSGSMTSRTASPSTLNASTTTVMAKPAPMIGQGEPKMLPSPSRMMFPQLG
jgi:AhpD family alkylhydroperoxidase